MRTKAVALGLLMGLMLLVGPSAASSAGDNGPRAEAAAKRTFARFQAKSLYKPSSLFFGAHEEISELTWSFWGKRRAQGTGTYRINRCDPSCAEGTITPVPANVVLTGRRSCGKRFVFKRLKVFFMLDGVNRENGSPAICAK